MNYTSLLELVKNQVACLSNNHQISISTNSWINQAILIVNNLIDAINSGLSENDYFSTEKLLYEKTISSLQQLYDLSTILTVVANPVSGPITKKLNSVFSAPLLMMDENPNTNEGRNTLFELRLFARLISKGFNPQLSPTHPDILLQINNHHYAFECKRPFKVDTLVSNVNDAISQLTRYSLDSKDCYGIVAVSITRCIHPGDKRLEVPSEQIAKAKLQQEMKKIVDSYRPSIFSDFSIRIPALFIEFSDRAVIDKPYNIDLIDVVETAQGGFSLFQTVKEDFANLE